MSFDFSPYDALVAGEQFGVIRDALRRRGINAVSCDIDPDRTGTGPHFQGDWDVAIQARHWPLIIFHPECTKLCVAGNHVYGEGKPRYNERLEAVAYTEQRWEWVKAHSDHAALENPQGVLPRLSKSMGPVGTWVQPYEHGDDASKKTGFHLHNLPPLAPEPAKWVKPRYVCCGLPLDMDLVGKYGCPNCHGDKKPLPRWANQTDSGQNRLGPSADRARLRAATYPGIADLIARVWGGHVFESSTDSVMDDLI